MAIMIPDTTAGLVTEFVDREVYTTAGTYVGTVTGVAVDLLAGRANSLTVADLNPHLFGPYPRGVRGVKLPFRWIEAVNDIILVATVVERFDPTDSSPTTGDDNE